jgi:hypothetical protein
MAFSSTWFDVCYCSVFWREYVLGDAGATGANVKKEKNVPFFYGLRLGWWKVLTRLTKSIASKGVLSY